MNGFYIELSKRSSRSPFRTVMGAVLLMAVAYFTFTGSPFFNAIQLFVFALAGLVYLVMGLGINPLAALSKAYISVDDDRLEYKPSATKKVQTIAWQDVTKVQIKYANIRFVLADTSSSELEYDSLNDMDAGKLKTTVISICRAKNITLD